MVLCDRTQLPLNIARTCPHTAWICTHCYTTTKLIPADICEKLFSSLTGVLDGRTHDMQACSHTARLLSHEHAHTHAQPAELCAQPYQHETPISYGHIIDYCVFDCALQKCHLISPRAAAAMVQLLMITLQHHQMSSSPCGCSCAALDAAARLLFLYSARQIIINQLICIFHIDRV